MFSKTTKQETKTRKHWDWKRGGLRKGFENNEVQKKKQEKEEGKERKWKIQRKQKRRGGIITNQNKKKNKNTNKMNKGTPQTLQKCRYLAILSPYYKKTKIQERNQRKMEGLGDVRWPFRPSHLNLSLPNPHPSQPNFHFRPEPLVQNLTSQRAWINIYI